MSIGFKEWALVCEALGRGEQSIILRKGGIAEGREGFRFQHGEFFLFPTLFHEQVAKLRIAPDTQVPPGGADTISIRQFARVEWTETIRDCAIARELAPFHIWRDEVIEERFRYDEKQELSLAFIRVFTLDEAWAFPNAPKYGGCRSWVTLPDAPANVPMRPALDEDAHRERQRALRTLIQAGD